MIQSVARKSDLCARWGGDEFAMALPNTDLAQAQALVARLRKSIDFISFAAGTVEIHEGENLDEVLQRADHKMYQIKRSQES